MKDVIKELVNKNAPLNVNINKIREYIQTYFLYSLHKKKLYANLTFCGCAALHYLYNLKRFSEDLYFSLSYKVKGLDFKSLLKILKDEFIAAGFTVDISYSMSTTVYNSFFKFPGLLYEYNLSPHKNEKISIKIEIDTNPPIGGKEELYLYNGSP